MYLNQIILMSIQEIIIKSIRNPVKWCRDRAKSAYEKKNCCHICGSTESLELHHFSSLTNLLEKWAKAKGYDISTDDGVLAIRDEFIAQHTAQIYDQVVTLCKKHHLLLHSIYGGKPALTTADRQSRWVEKQKDKYGNN